MKRFALFVSLITLSSIMFYSCSEVIQSDNGIQSEFLGIKFGDTIEDIKIKNPSKDLSVDGDWIIEHHVEFAGRKWDEMQIKLKNNKVCLINFVNKTFSGNADMGLLSETGRLESNFDEILSDLIKKYDMKEFKNGYYDEIGNKRVELIISYGFVYDELILRYEDKNLSGKSKKESDTFKQI